MLEKSLKIIKPNNFNTYYLQQNNFYSVHFKNKIIIFNLAIIWTFDLSLRLLIGLPHSDSYRFERNQNITIRVFPKDRYWVQFYLSSV